MSFDLNRYKTYSGPKGDVSLMEEGAKRALQKFTESEIEKGKYFDEAPKPSEPEKKDKGKKKNRLAEALRNI